MPYSGRIGSEVNAHTRQNEEENKKHDVRTKKNLIPSYDLHNIVI